MDQGIIESVEEEAHNDLGVVGVIYLPHRKILKPDRVITEIRVVFDASAKSKAPCLNGCLAARSSLLPFLYDILLRF